MDNGQLTSPNETHASPRWVQDAIFYQIFPDRFAQSTRVPKPRNLEPWDSTPTIYGFKGGDLVGVTEHLDYLQDLGINALYLCPVFRSTANHRYHTHDYYEIDPILGGTAAFSSLLEEAHRRDIRIVLDGVFNHCSRGFYQFNHLLENGSDSPYLDWFRIQSWPLYPYGPADDAPGYDSWWGNRALPEFNTNTPAVREYLWSVGEYWIQQGVDGWRLDVPNEIDDDAFWREFRRRVKRVNPDAYIVGEIWGDARRWLQGDQFDAVMNYLFTKACIGFFKGPRGINAEVLQGTGLFPILEIDAPQFCQSIESILGMYPWSATLGQLNLLDSHDTARYLTVNYGDESAYRLAVLFAMTFPGAPCIYYGDEVGMTGGGPVENARGGFNWNEDSWNHELRNHVKGCIELRHSCEVLRRGDFTTLHAQGDIFAFSRRLGDDIAYVAFNVGESACSIDVRTVPNTKSTQLRSIWEESNPAVSDGMIQSWQLAPRTGSVLVGAL
ncbi:MAG: glycoside hydrolase family 13 protein [Chloroflexota bacterium]